MFSAILQSLRQFACFVNQVAKELEALTIHLLRLIGLLIAGIIIALEELSHLTGYLKTAFAFIWTN